jgi:hypothetical protein
MGRIVKCVLLRQHGAWQDLELASKTIARRGWFRYLDENGKIIQRAVENVVYANNDGRSGMVAADIYLTDDDIRDDGFMRIPITGWVRSSLIDELPRGAANPATVHDFERSCSIDIPVDSLRGICGGVIGMAV